MGLPGCGKSTFAKSLLDLQEQSCKRKKKMSTSYYVSSECIDIGSHEDAPITTHFDKVLVIDYDDIAKQELALSSGEKNDSGMHNTSFDSNDLQAWRKSRVKALATLKDTLFAHFTEEDNKGPSSILIFMDDNFHLRGMRRDVYKTCQEILATNAKAQIGFSTTHFTTPLQICLERNNTRKGKECIPIDVISRMAEEIEPPDISKPYASFERYHVSIDNSADDTEDIKLLKKVHTCIQQSLQYPIKPTIMLTQEDTAQLEQQRIAQQEETRKCQTQQIDQLLRKLVGAVGRVEKKRSREANEVRKSIIERIRSRDNDMANMSKDAVVQHFACAMLGIDIDMNNTWRDIDSHIVQSIKDTLQDKT